MDLLTYIMARNGASSQATAAEQSAAAALESAQDASEAAEAAELFAAQATVTAGVAPYFDEDDDYSAGDYVYYDDTLYRFDAAHPAGAWTGEDATPATISSELTNVKSALTKSGLLFVGDLYPQDYTVENIFINSSIKWSDSGKSIFIPVSDTINTITVKANSSNLTLVALLTTNQYSKNSAVSTFANGTTRTIIPAGETETFAIPSDCQYINIAMSYSTNDYTPAEIKTYKSAISEINATIVANDEKVDELIEKLITNKSIDLDEFETYNILISSSTSKWGATGNDRACWIIPCDADSVLKVSMTANSNALTAYAFLTSNAHEEGTTPAYCPGTGRSVLSEGESITLDVPSTCKYLYVLKLYSSTIYTPSALSFVVIGANTNADGINAYPIGLHTMPQNNGVLNVIKRCRQMTDIKWTPAVDLPRYMYVSPTPPSDDNYDTSDVEDYLGVFKAGTEYTGIPYGRSYSIDDYGYSHSFVGFDIDFETFVTAVGNPESIISKENIGDASEHISIQYAAVCSALACYALGLSNYYATANISNIPNLNLITPLKVDNEFIDPSTFKLGDLVNLASYHVAIITDIALDSNGNVAFIEECEATTVGEANPDYSGGLVGGLCRRVGFTVDDFFARFGDYSLYRYANIASVPYAPSKYVNVGDEINMFRFNRLPAMPYMGEGFKYKSGHIPNTKIVITCDNYSYLRVFKDGTEITGSPFSVNASQGYVETGFSETGNYEAYLCNMSGGSNTSVTAKCHWTVV